MKTILTLLFSWLAINMLNAQEISSYLVGNAGDHFENSAGITLDWSLGEPCTKTLSNQVQITQGFHQTYSITIPVRDWDTSLDVKVYPNPFASSFTIESAADDTFDFEIRDAMGRSLVRKKGNWQKYTQSLENQADQALYLTISSRKGKQTLLLIKSTF